MTLSAMAGPAEESAAAAVRMYVGDLVSRVLTSMSLPEDKLSHAVHIDEHCSCLKSQPALDILGGALMAKHITVDNSSPCHAACVPTDVQDDMDDAGTDDIVVFDEGSSFGSEDEGFWLGEPTRTQRTRARLQLIGGRMHLRVADTMGAMRKGMSFLGDRLEALGDSLDDAAEKYTHQIEQLEDTVRSKMAVISHKSQAAAEKYSPKIELLEDVVRVNMTALSDKSHATYERLDCTATKCKRHLEGGAEMVVEKARVLSHAAGTVRAKTGKLATVGSVRKSFQRARGSMQPRNVRKGLNLARDRVHQSFASASAGSRWSSGLTPRMPDFRCGA